MRRDYSMSFGLISAHLRLNLVQLLFLISAVLAPLDLELVVSFTVYDLVVAIIASLLMLTGPRGMCFPPADVVAASFVFLLFALLSAFRGPYPVEALTQTLQFGFVFFIQLPVIFTVVRSWSSLGAALIMLLGGMLIGAVGSMAFGEVQGAHRALAFYSANPNRLGFPTAYFLPFAMYFLMDVWRRKKYVIGVGLVPVAIFPMIWALTASASRSSMLATLIGLVMFLSFRRGFAINVALCLRILFSILVVVVVGYAIYASDYFSTSVLKTRIERTLAFESTLIDDRRRLAVAGWRAFLESPLIGVGLDNFRYVAQHYEVAIEKGQLPHNLWLQLLAQVGLAGTVAFLILMMTWYLSLFRAQRINISSAQRELICAFIASMTAIMTIFMFAPLMINRHYWLIYGLGLTAVALTKTKGEPKIVARDGTARETERTGWSR